MDPLGMTDAQLGAYLALLDDAQLAAALARIDTAQRLDEQRTISLADSAAYIAGVWGWPVFPCVPRGKKPLTQHGFKDATTDRNIIASWWMRWPEANIGTPTGADGCGLDVIDIDGREGLRSYHQIIDPPTPVARSFTPGDDGGPGWHHFITPTGDGNATGAYPGVDFRGLGGYVILPPSVGANGRRYTWLERPAA